MCIISLINCSKGVNDTVSVQFYAGEMIYMLESMIEEKTEEKREEMIELAMELGFTAMETVVCSQELDELIHIKLTSYEYVNLPIHRKH
jgi:stage 0 sporulation regulatory protein